MTSTAKMTMIKATSGINSARHFESRNDSCKASQVATRSITVPTMLNSGPATGMMCNQVMISGMWANPTARNVRVKVPCPLNARPATVASRMINDQISSVPRMSSTNFNSGAPGKDSLKASNIPEATPNKIKMSVILHTLRDTLS